jgi:hypothetical protein
MSPYVANRTGRRNRRRRADATGRIGISTLQSRRKWFYGRKGSIEGGDDFCRVTSAAKAIRRLGLQKLSSFDHVASGAIAQSDNSDSL